MAISGLAARLNEHSMMVRGSAYLSREPSMDGGLWSVVSSPSRFGQIAGHLVYSIESALASAINSSSESMGFQGAEFVFEGLAQALSFIAVGLGYVVATPFWLAANIVGLFAAREAIPYERDIGKLRAYQSCVHAIRRGNSREIARATRDVARDISYATWMSGYFFQAAKEEGLQELEVTERVLSKIVKSAERDGLLTRLHLKKTRKRDPKLRELLEEVGREIWQEKPVALSKIRTETHRTWDLLREHRKFEEGFYSRDPYVAARKACANASVHLEEVQRKTEFNHGDLQLIRGQLDCARANLSEAIRRSRGPQEKQNVQAQAPLPTQEEAIRHRGAFEEGDESGSESGGEFGDVLTAFEQMPPQTVWVQ